MLTDAYDLFAPVPEVAPTDLNDPLKFAQFYFVFRDRLQALRPFLRRAAEGGTPDAPSGPEAPAKTYTVAALREMTGLSNTTLNQYAKQAKVTTPRRGQRNFRYSAADARAILSHIIEQTSEDALRARCQAALADPKEITE